MFKDSQCVFVAFFSEPQSEVDKETRLMTFNPRMLVKDEILQAEREIAKNDGTFSNEPEIPRWLREQAAEEIRDDILEYVRKNFPEAEFSPSDSVEICETFWKVNGIDKFRVYDPETLSKMIKAEGLFNEERMKSDLEKREKSFNVGIPSVKEFIKRPQSIDTQDELISHKENAEVTETEETSNIERLRNSSPEEIGNQMLEFLEKELVQEGLPIEELGFRKLWELFWKSKGIEHFYMPSDLRTKILKAEYFAEKELIKRKNEKRNGEETKQTQVALQEISGVSPEKLASEMVEFIKKEYPENPLSDFWRHKQHFWETRSDDDSPNSFEVRNKVESISERELEKMVKDQERHRLQKETEELPTLINQCTDWARNKNLQTITLPDLDVFLLEKKRDVTYTTKRAIWSTVKLELKLKKTQS